MTAKEVEIILIEGLIHTPETRIDFYLSKAKENNLTPANLCLALYEAYKRLEKYVNSKDYSTWGIDEITGKRIYCINCIALHPFTGGKLLGTLTDDNITDLLPGLLEMTKQLKLELINQSGQTDEAAKPIYRGFQSSLTDNQIETLFDQLKGRYIDNNTNPDHFKATFKPDPLPDGFVPIKKTKQFTGTLLAYFVSGLFQKENQSDYWHIAANCFERAKNLKQSLTNAYNYNPEGKPKGYKDIDTIIKSIYPPLQ